MNFQTICRICIEENSEMVSIFESYKFSAQNYEIFKVITDCACVQIQKFDGFSEQICRSCLDRLSQAYCFKKLCEDSDYKFRNGLIVSNKMEIKNEFPKEDDELLCGEIDNCFTDATDSNNQMIDVRLSPIQSDNPDSLQKQKVRKRTFGSKPYLDHHKTRTRENQYKLRKQPVYESTNDFVTSDAFEIKSEYSEEDTEINYGENRNDDHGGVKDEEPEVPTVSSGEFAFIKCEETSKSEYSQEITTDEAAEKARNSGLLPEKSKELYEKNYMEYLKWCNLRKDSIENCYCEKSLLAYFSDLSKERKPSSLWSYYSMLKATIKANHDVDISKYSSLLGFLKRKSDGFKPKQELPEKSKELYEKNYTEYLKWCNLRKDSIENCYCEKSLLAYFSDLSKERKPSSLWSYFSMLKATIKANHDVDISKYSSLLGFLKRKSDGFKPKQSKVLTMEEIETFLYEAPDEIYLMYKVALIFGIAGACSKQELTQLKVDDIQELQSTLLVTLKDTTTKTNRMFSVVDNQKSPSPVDIYKKYASLRPSGTESGRFFLSYKNGKCTKQVVGKNSFGEIPKKIATYLKLSNPELYTGHSFRRSSATLLANAEEGMFGVKQIVGSI